MKFTIALLAGLLMMGSAFAQQKEQRVALVIGNSAYKQGPLRNPVNDARDMAARLRSLGFTVIERSNLGIKQIGSTLREFRAKLTPGSVALVFYAGHGVQIKGENYLPAVDAEISGEEDVPNQSLAVRQIMDVLGDAKTRLNLVFLDACRDNPYARTFRTASRGLSKENAPSGTLISFATRPGSLAADGVGKNGLYTGALLLAMNDANRPIEQILKTVVTSVKAGSKNLQEPWMEGSIEGEFCFGDCTRVVQSVVPEMSAAQREDAFWADAKVAGNKEAFEAYVINYPTGRYANLARANIARLSTANVQVVIAPPVVPPVIASPLRLSAAASNKVATVNGVAIPKSRVDAIVKERAQQGMPDNEEMRKAIREELINREIIVQEANRRGLTKNADMQSQIDMARQAVVVRAFLQDFVNAHPVSDEAIKAEYEKVKGQMGNKEYKARHILVEKEAEAQDIVAKIKKGEKFEELAKASMDPGSKDKGGDLDWNTPASYVKEFSDALTKLEKGKYTEVPVKTQFGHHVIQLDDVRDVKFPMVDEVKAGLQQRLQQQQLEKEVADLRAKTVSINSTSIPTERIDAIVKERAQNGMPDNEEMRKAIREELINREIIVQEANRRGLTKSPEFQEMLVMAEQAVVVRAFTQDLVKTNPTSPQWAQQEMLERAVAERRARVRIE